MSNVLRFAIFFKNADYSCKIAIPNAPIEKKKKKLKLKLKIKKKKKM
jgi:hypothetical protein